MIINQATTPLPHNSIEKFFDGWSHTLDAIVTLSVIAFAITATITLLLMMRPEIKKMNTARINRKIKKSFNTRLRNDRKVAEALGVPVQRSLNGSVHIAKVWKQD